MISKFLSTVAAIALMGSATLVGSATLAQTTETDATGNIVVPEAEAGAEAGATTEMESDADVAQDAAPMTTGDGTETAQDAAPMTTGDGTETAQDAAPLPTDGESETAEETVPPATDGTTGTAVATDATTGDDRAGLYGTFADARVTDLIGMDVIAANGDDIGEVDDLVHDGEVVKAVVGVGGFLGLGEHKVALPLADFTMGEDALQVGAMTKEDLEGMPEYAGESESLPLDTTVAGEPIAQEELMTDPAVPSDG